MFLPGCSGVGGCCQGSSVSLEWSQMWIVTLVCPLCLNTCSNSVHNWTEMTKLLNVRCCYGIHSLASFLLFDNFSLNCRCQLCRSAFIHSLLPSTEACLMKLRAFLLRFYEHEIISVALNPSNMANLRNTMHTHTNTHTLSKCCLSSALRQIQHCCVTSAGFLYIGWVSWISCFSETS